MHLGVLLLYCQEGRATTFTREWAERAIKRTAEYLFAQSGGREAITYKVFDWVPLRETAAEWTALKWGAYKVIRPQVEQAIGESLSPFSHILIGIDHPQSESGAWDPGTNVIHLAATWFAPIHVAHELAHCFGAADAYGEMPSGPPVMYYNQFCIMGGGSNFADTVLDDPKAPGLNRSGPAMSAPTLLGTGWLKEVDHGLGIDLSQSHTVFGAGSIVELSALEGAPGPGWARPPVVVRYKDLLIEYRVRDGWDRALPAPPGAGAGGWLVLHRSAVSSPAAGLIMSVQATPGEEVVLGAENPSDIFKPGPLKLSVLSYDALKRTVRFRLWRREGKRLPGVTTYGGVDVGGGGLIWTPGRGFTRVPPRSPLLQVIESVVRVQALEDLLAVASQGEVSGLTEEASHAVRALQGRVADVRLGPER